MSLSNTSLNFADVVAAVITLLMCRWEDTLKTILAPRGTTSEGGSVAGCSRLYEVGPGHQIKAMVRRISTTTWKDFTNVAAA